MPKLGGKRVPSKVKCTSLDNPTKELVFHSLSKASDFLLSNGFNETTHHRSRLRTHLHNNLPYCGYKWSFIESTDDFPSHMNCEYTIYVDATTSIKVRATCDEPRQISLYDLISGVRKEAYQHFARLLVAYPELKSLITYHTFPGQGQRPTPVISECDVRQVVCMVLSNSRLPQSHKLKVVEGLNINETKYVGILRKNTEQEMVRILCNSFRDCDPVTQFYVEPFRIDLYLKKCNIAIECDEFGHKNYNKTDDSVRTSYIDSKLQCKWVRFDPYEKDFCIGNVIFEIINMIRNN